MIFRTPFLPGFSLHWNLEARQSSQQLSLQATQPPLGQCTKNCQLSIVYICYLYTAVIPISHLPLLQVPITKVGLYLYIYKQPTKLAIYPVMFTDNRDRTGKRSVASTLAMSIPKKNVKYNYIYISGHHQHHLWSINYIRL